MSLIRISDPEHRLPRVIPSIVIRKEILRENVVKKLRSKQNISDSYLSVVMRSNNII